MRGLELTGRNGGRWLPVFWYSVLSMVLLPLLLPVFITVLATMLTLALPIACTVLLLYLMQVRIISYSQNYSYILELLGNGIAIYCGRDGLAIFGQCENVKSLETKEISSSFCRNPQQHRDEAETSHAPPESRCSSSRNSQNDSPNENVPLKDMAHADFRQFCSLKRDTDSVLIRDTGHQRVCLTAENDEDRACISPLLHAEEKYESIPGGKEEDVEFFIHQRKRFERQDFGEIESVIREFEEASLLRQRVFEQSHNNLESFSWSSAATSSVERFDYEDLENCIQVPVEDRFDGKASPELCLSMLEFLEEGRNGKASATSIDSSVSPEDFYLSPMTEVEMKHSSRSGSPSIENVDQSFISFPSSAGAQSELKHEKKSECISEVPQFNNNEESLISTNGHSLAEVQQICNEVGDGVTGGVNAEENCAESKNPTHSAQHILNPKEILEQPDKKTWKRIASGLERRVRVVTKPANESKTKAFVEYINARLADDNVLCDRLPPNPSKNDLFDIVKEGVLLCKLINIAVPGTIDERAINSKHKLSLQEKLENHTLCLNSAIAIGCSVAEIKPQDLVEAQPHLIFHLMEQILKVHPVINVNVVKTSRDARLSNISPRSNVASDSEDGPLFEAIEENDQDSREERVFRLWIKSIGFSYVNDLFMDVRDGWLLLAILDKIAHRSVNWKIANKPPIEMPFKKIENCNQVIAIGRRLKFSLVNVDGHDFVKGNKKLILGFLWQLMRYDFLNLLKELQLHGGKEVSDADILCWTNEIVRKAGKISHMESFRDKSLSNGIFFLDLLWALKPEAVNWSLVTKGETEEDKKRNAIYVLSVARKLGCTVFLLWDDIVQVRPKMIMILAASIMLWFLEERAKGLSEVVNIVT